MASPPFNPNQTLPEDDDIISQYPVTARLFRDIMESWMLVGHDRNGLHAAVGLADLVAARPDGTADVVTIWQEDGVIYVRNEVLGTLYTIPYHLYNALVTGIPNNALAPMVAGTIKGRSAGTDGVPEDLTPTQAAAIVGTFTPDTGVVVGLKGSVPAPPIGAAAGGKVLSAAGTWINLGAPHVILADHKAISVDGGTFTSGAWRKRDINTEVHDLFGLATIVSGDRFTLPAGTYVIKWSAPAYGVGAHVTRLANVTAATVAAAGTPEDCGQVGVGWESYGVVAVLVQTRSIGTAKLVITGSTTFAIEHQAQNTRATDGFGRSHFAQAPSVYTQVDIWKVG